ncbi:MAG: GAF domain-containing protein [Anaerolineae bacterium]|nr:GAF domain-containing protein [Anaerolineae bacterium]
MSEEMVNIPAESQVIRLVHDLNLQLGSILVDDDFIEAFGPFVVSQFQCERLALLANLQNDTSSLEHASSWPKTTDPDQLHAQRSLFLDLNELEAHTLTQPLIAGKLIRTTSKHLADTPLSAIARLLPEADLTFVPLLGGADTVLVGLLVLEKSDDVDDERLPLDDTLLSILGTTCGAFLAHTLEHTHTVDQFSTNMHEMNILQQIDAELNDTIALDKVFEMLLDWALRFTNASAASMAMYDVDTDTLTMMLQYGYQQPDLKAGEIVPHQRGGITLRVARSGHAELIGNVQDDPDYVPLSEEMHTQLSTPIFREERVIAVMTLQSTKPNGFRDNHVNFVDKLTRRAGVAVDNARLFEQTNRERQKLSLILGGIADSVIVVDHDGHILLVNQSAVNAFNLRSESVLIGKKFTETIHHEGLIQLYKSAINRDEQVIRELELPNERTYHAAISDHSSIGIIIVMHDVTHYKETDQLKNELVATVSHDLKQPLSVMRGYLDLLQMTNEFNERSQRYVSQLFNAFHHMKQLIDDILDLARIEAGIELSLDGVDLNKVLAQSVVAIRPSADNKIINLTTDLPQLPTIRADEGRIRQIFTNLISNAVKYTPSGGWVKVSAEIKPGHVKIVVQDNGLGISPEDQAHIFDRFYRVRRPETDDIEGTGLGLAIVRSLVEAHHGEISLISRLGEGSSFRVTLPIT